MSPAAAVQADQLARRAELLIWPVALWPEEDRQIWLRSRLGKGIDGRDNPAVGWNERTAEKNEDGYGRYLSWLNREGLLIEDEAVTKRITAARVAKFVDSLTSHLSSVSIGMTIGALTSAVRAFRPDTNWSWLARRSTRLKLKAKPSREKRHAIQHTLDLYRFGRHVMDTADRGKGKTVHAAQRYRWDGASYWLIFGTNETKTNTPIEEPLPDDLAPYLELFLRTWRPVLLRQAKKYGGVPAHRRLWVDRFGHPMREAALRSLIKRYTGNEFGTAVWPHLFRDCLLTSVAIDQPDLMRISATLLGHASSSTGEKHYNQARMLDASRQYGMTIFKLRQALLMTPTGERDGSDS